MSSWPRRVFYIRNQKAASKFLLANMKNMFNAADKTARGVVRSEVKQLVADKPRDFLFTVVREPASAALAAYLTATRLSLKYRSSKMSHADQSSVFFTGCSKVNATERFILFLDQAQRRIDLGHSTFHAFPQVIKIGHVQPRHRTDGSTESSGDTYTFDAIGRVETLMDDLEAIRALVGLRASWKGITQNARTTHTTTELACANVNMSHPTIVRKICELYAADFTCLGYRPPPLCRQEQRF